MTYEEAIIILEEGDEDFMEQILGIQVYFE